MLQESASLEHDGLDPFIEQHGQNAYHQALEQVQGGHCQQDKGGNAGDAAVDLGACRHDLVQGPVVHFRVGGQQIDRVKQAAEDSHDQRSHAQARDGGALGPLAVIDHGGGEHQGAAHGEVGQLAHEGRGGSLEQELDEDLQNLRQHARDRPQVEGTDQHWQLGEIHLVEIGGQKQKGKLQEHEQARQGGGDGHGGDVLWRGQPQPILAAEALEQRGQDQQPCHHGKADQNELYSRVHEKYLPEKYA